MTLLKKIGLLLAAVAILILLLLLSMVRPDISADTLHERYTDDASTLMSIDGMEVHVNDVGSGPTLLMLHGMFASLHTWDAWADAFHDEYRVVRVDLPGFGLTGPHPDGDYSLRASMHLLESIRDELQIDRWTVIGNSMGAGLALSYAQLFPDHTDGIVLFNGGRLLSLPTRADRESTGQPPATEERRTAEARPSRVLQALGNPVLRKMLSVMTPKFLISSALGEVYGNAERLQPETVTRYYQLLRREGNRQAYLSRTQGSTREPAELPPLPEPVGISESAIPVLILWGELDSWIPVHRGRQLHNAIPHSELILYPDLGHVPMEEDPARTIADVRRFLEAAH
ncbi:MAG: alpha/beta fold hydrolase [Balneolaceae bacterium]